MKKIRIVIFLMASWSTAWSQTNTFPTSGDAGIGTTSPSGSISSNQTGLHILNDNVSYLSLESTAGSGKKYTMYSSTAGSLVFWDASSSTMRGIIDINGKWGIGTTSPLADLQVGDGTTDAGIRSYYSDNSYTEMRGYGIKSNRSAFYIRGTVDGTQTLRLGNTDKNFDIVYAHADNHISFANGTSEKVRFNMINGNVGIGTQSPETKLQVKNGVIKSGTDNATKGTLQFAGNYSGNNLLNTYGSQYSSGATSIGYAVKQKYQSQGIVSSAGNSNFKKGMLLIDQELEFLNAGASTVPIDSDVSLTSRFIVKENGDVGIGTTNTFGYKLAVNGTIGSTEVKVESTSAWPDYVFDKAYELRSLEEVEEHIAKNGHLHGIPNEAEVAKNGINLGEMDVKLLQKIEELTLYLIEQNKEIMQMKKEISALKNK